MRFFLEAIRLNLGDKPRITLFALAQDLADIADIGDNYNKLTR
jgi:hypothetical protein